MINPLEAYSRQHATAIGAQNATFDRVSQSLDRAFAMIADSINQAAKAKLIRQELASKEKIASQELANRSDIASQELANRSNIALQELANRSNIADKQIAASERELQAKLAESAADRELNTARLDLDQQLGLSELATRQQILQQNALRMLTDWEQSKNTQRLADINNQLAQTQLDIAKERIPIDRKELELRSENLKTQGKSLELQNKSLESNIEQSKYSLALEAAKEGYSIPDYPRLISTNIFNLDTLGFDSDIKRMVEQLPPGMQRSLIPAIIAQRDTEKRDDKRINAQQLSAATNDLDNAIKQGPAAQILSAASALKAIPGGILTDAQEGAVTQAKSRIHAEISGRLDKITDFDLENLRSIAADLNTMSQMEIAPPNVISNTAGDIAEKAIKNFDSSIKAKDVSKLEDFAYTLAKMKPRGHNVAIPPAPKLVDSFFILNPHSWQYGTREELETRLKLYRDTDAD